MNRILQFLPFVLFIACTNVSSGQEGKPLRIEIEAKALVDDYFVIPAGEQGLVLLFDDEDSDRKDAWTLTAYNTELQESWQHRIVFDVPMSYLDKYQTGTTLQSLFVSRAGRSRIMGLVSIDLLTGVIEQTYKPLPNDFIPKVFLVHKSNGWILGDSSPTGFTHGKGNKSTPTLILLNFNNRDLSVVSLHEQKNTTLLSAFIDTSHARLHILLKPIAGNRKSGGLLWLITDIFGGSNQTIHIGAEKGKDFADAEIIEDIEGNVIVLGSYRSLQAGATAMSEGLFMASMDNKALRFIRYYPFIDFKKFGQTLPVSLLKTAARRRSRGKEANVGFRLLFHDEIISLDTVLIVRAESYQPQYRTEYQHDPMYGYGHTVEVFEGWRYNYALIAGFGQSGSLLWDQAMNMSNVLEATKLPREHVELLIADDEVISVYTTEGFLYSLVIEHGKVLEPQSRTPIETIERGDKVRANFRSDLSYWYDEYLLVWGYQRINTEGKKREVFYFNKIAYR